MPLSEKLRLDAGRSFTHTLIARVYVALALVVLMLVVTNKHKINFSDPLIFGQTQQIKLSDLPVVTNAPIIMNTNYETILTTKNDTYGR